MLLLFDATVEIPLSGFDTAVITSLLQNPLC